MQWSKTGAHQLLVMRTTVLNDELEGEFEKQYPLSRAQSSGAMLIAT
ncbi:hypothetical protein GO730_38745 [Spirosoma sp. HMF3257]|nr:hypothetical protein [Spirosoma telluris]